MALFNHKRKNSKTLSPFLSSADKEQALFITSCCLTTQDSEDFPSIQSKTNLLISSCWDYSGTLSAYISLCFISNTINETVNFLVLIPLPVIDVVCFLSGVCGGQPVPAAVAVPDSVGRERVQ